MSSEIGPDSPTLSTPLLQPSQPSIPPETVTVPVTTPETVTVTTPETTSASSDASTTAEGPTPSKLLSSKPRTFANVFISIVGTGVLGLPYSFKRAGWVVSLVTLFIAAFLTHHCMMLLILTRRKLESESHASERHALERTLSEPHAQTDPEQPDPTLPEPHSQPDPTLTEHQVTRKSFHSFGDFGEALFGGYWGRLAIDLLIVFAQAGFCVGYVSFISATLTQIFNPHVGHSYKILGWCAPRTLYVLGCFLVQVLLNSIQTLNGFAPWSIFADVADVIAMALMLVVDGVRMVKRESADIRQLKPYVNVPMCFYGMGVSVYSFEGIAMVLPLEDEARDKERFGWVLGLAMLFIALMYGFFGVLGYFAFGEETEAVITLNLGNGVLSAVVNVGLVINILVKLPIMMQPVYEVVERDFWGGEVCLWLRWLLVLGVCSVAWLVPNFSGFMASSGNVICCVLGFVLPSLFHLMVFWRETRRKQLLLDVGIIAMGVILGAWGIWFAWQDM